MPLAEVNNKLRLQKAHSERREDVKITPDSCFYFYQAKSGEPIYLHPLCLQMLQADGPLPLLIRDLSILETESAADKPVPEFLGHLPPAASHCLIEIDLTQLVAKETLKKFAP